MLTYNIFKYYIVQSTFALRTPHATLPTLCFIPIHHYIRRLAKRIGAMNLEAMTTTPSVAPVTQRSKTDAKSAYWTLGYSGNDLDNQSSEDDEESVKSSMSAIPVFNDAMEKLGQIATSTNHVNPLTFQLKTSWSEAKEEEKEVCIDKATEACNLVCEIIAPKAGPELFESCCSMPKEDTYRPCTPNASIQQGSDKKC